MSAVSTCICNFITLTQVYV